MEETYTLREYGRIEQMRAQPREGLGGGYELQMGALPMRDNHFYYPYPHFLTQHPINLPGAGMQALHQAGVGSATGIARLLG